MQWYYQDGEAQSFTHDRVSASYSLGSSTSNRIVSHCSSVCSVCPFVHSQVLLARKGVFCLCVCCRCTVARRAYESIRRQRGDCRSAATAVCCERLRRCCCWWWVRCDDREVDRGLHAQLVHRDRQSDGHQLWTCTRFGVVERCSSCTTDWPLSSLDESTHIESTCTAPLPSRAESADCMYSVHSTRNREVA